MSSRFRFIGPALGAFLASAVIFITLTSHEDRAAAYATSVENTVAPSCRAGVTAQAPKHIDWIDTVGAGWYVYFGGFPDTSASDANIAPIISVKQDKDGPVYLDSYTINPSLEGLLPWLQAHPGTLWIVGNEVDRGPDPGETSGGQGDTFPDVYARAYAEIYHHIKQHDPTALVANSALVQVTPGRLQYLDLMWQAYLDQFGEPMPVDVWNMHIYILPEAELDGTPNGIANVALASDPALAKRGPGANYSQCPLDEIYCYAEHDDLGIFEQQVRAMRNWMYKHGQQRKPLILSEYSILYPCLDPDPQGNCLYLQDEKGNDFDQQRVQDWLVATTTFLESATDSRIGNPLDGGRLVQQWAWFSINNAGGVGDVSDLVDFAEADDRLTALGQQYQVLAANLAAYVNLTPAGVPAMTAETAIQGGTVDVPLRANIVNNGSVPVTGAFQVTFYADSALTQIIGQAEVAAPDANDPVLANCALRTVPVSVSWPGLAAGMHPFWVELDSQQDVEESTEDDNVTSSFVLVNPRRVSLPNISR